MMGSNVSGSNELIRRILAGDLPSHPDFWTPIIDVRDLAEAHLLAMPPSLLSNGSSLVVVRGSP
ncbi:hypothetical protein RSal33209_0793 [Renibacterium salmoninarum ATCC 33209]|uniref:Uncharacterized protein n=1 Tax=Renibacterium salmoninarum (strain ATCC 33209 / DSM 20767 / JCM 11484 / NBRC 15589 / NCIMB 2235) TaxID=288705 RepID=A9WQA0_RENSM|nr:hypothetical protein RSal33209_0793 [Renibacterium salmoninarum ATCC 33209]